MAAGSIVVDLLMKTGSFETDTKRAEKRLREMKKEAEAFGRAIGVAFAAAGVASLALVKSAIDAADEMGKLAQKTGTTVEELSALAYAADLSGVSQEELGGALVKLTKNMSDAARGTGDAIEGFKALGISVKNADGSLKSSNQVLQEVSGKFAGFRDGAEKTALAVNIFGKSGANLIPLLNSGSAGLESMREEAERLGVVLSTDAAKGAEVFNDNLTRLGKSILGIANRATADLLPALNDVSQAFVDMAKSQAFIETTSAIVNTVIKGLITVFQTVAVVGSDVGFVFLGIGREIGALVAQMGALARLDINGFKAISEAVKEDGERARAELDKFQARILAIGSTSPQEFSNEGRNARGPQGGIAPRLASAAGRTGKAEKPPEFSAIRDPYAKQRNDFLRTEKEAYEDIAKAIRDRTKAEEELLALQRVSQTLDPLEQIKNDFLRSEKDYEGASNALKDLIEQQEKSQTLGQSIGYAFAGAFEDAIVGATKFSDAVKRLGQDILRLLVNKFVTQAIVGAVDANFGTAGSSGTVTGGTGLTARATGGPVSEGGAYMVGERGPEMFVPNTAGRILPNSASGGGAVDVQVINNGAPATAKATTSRQDGRTMVKVVLDAVGASIASGSGSPADGMRARGFNMNGALPRRA